MTPHLAANMWVDAIGDHPVEAVVAAAAMTAAAVGAGIGLRAVTARTRSLRQLVLAIALASLAIGAVAAIVLARLMVLDAAQARTAIGVLATTAVFAVVLALVASVPLGRDAQRLESAVRRLEVGDRTARTGVRRADELGHVAKALDELTERLDTLERERASFEQERRAMLTSVGHDLRTPLSALRAAIEALADGVAPDPQRYLRAMSRDVEALGSLVDDLFLLSRIESGRLELLRETVDVSEIADEAIEALAPVARQRGITLEFRRENEAVVVAGPHELG
ncbi:MAG: HAMP domain-containing protein, partial [Actinomycetota bacterium]|nr:HAMP domain-containing protein [Actinomycetota bacterium]